MHTVATMLKDKGDYTRGDIMRILVFGAIGYVGAHVYQQWAADPQAAGRARLSREIVASARLNDDRSAVSGVHAKFYHDLGLGLYAPLEISPRVFRNSRLPTFGGHQHLSGV